MVINYCGLCIKQSTQLCPRDNVYYNDDACELFLRECPQDDNYCCEWEDENGEY